jgi:hypothetical protein
MKISIGINLQQGSWGGGNRFGQDLADFLRSMGEEVTFDLKDRDIDLILLTEPNKKLKTSAYNHKDILKYLLFRNPRALVVHRINNTSEARNDEAKTFNHYRINANRSADYTVFISRWVHARYEESGFSSPHYRVILNGANHRIWKPSKALVSVGFTEGAYHLETKGSSKLGLVTHHWSKNVNKGFDIYKKLDKLLDNPYLSERIFFTYVGRFPDGFRYKNCNYVEPLNGGELATKINEHDIYLTASQNESAGMHHIEGALCGLPVLYRNSGAFGEYCHGFGLEFNEGNFEDKLHQMVREVNQWKARMKDYPFTSDRMCGEYHKLFKELLSKRESILKRRRITHWIKAVVMS